MVRRAGQLSQTADYEGAIELLERAVELDPDNAVAFTERGWALENLGPEHAEEAQAAYEKALALDPQSPWAREGLAHVLETRGNVEEARAIYRSIVEEFGDDRQTDPDLLEIGGWSHHRLGEHEAAEPMFRKALTIEPGRPSLGFDLALVLFHLGRPEEALAQLEATLRTLETADPRRHRAAVQVALDDFQHAFIENERLGTSPEAVRALAALESVLAVLPEP
ncbi:MAG: tetratricopeptide repeat protein [Actinomycetota bacterium]|nr:tetratricopeptide repeat protein [Actinomycetota bacterium]